MSNRRYRRWHVVACLIGLAVGATSGAARAMWRDSTEVNAELTAGVAAVYLGSTSSLGEAALLENPPDQLTYALPISEIAAELTAHQGEPVFAEFGIAAAANTAVDIAYSFAANSTAFSDNVTVSIWILGEDAAVCDESSYQELLPAEIQYSGLLAELALPAPQLLSLAPVSDATEEDSLAAWGEDSQLYCIRFHPRTDSALVPQRHEVELSATVGGAEMDESAEVATNTDWTVNFEGFDYRALTSESPTIIHTEVKYLQPEIVVLEIDPEMSELSEANSAPSVPNVE